MGDKRPYAQMHTTDTGFIRRLLQLEQQGQEALIFTGEAISGYRMYTFNFYETEGSTETTKKNSTL